MIKKLGIPKEVKQDEGRIALIPKHITQFTRLADIFVETKAGLGSGFTDKDYEDHLIGKKSIGIQPCDDDGLAIFGAIDIDSKAYQDFSPKKYLEIIEKNKCDYE